MLNTVSDISGVAPWRQDPARRSDLAAAIRHIEIHFTERLTLGHLEVIAGLSIFRFVTVFRRQMGISPLRYLCAIRVQAVQALLRNLERGRGRFNLL